jgi:hypothetical protein
MWKCNSESFIWQRCTPRIDVGGGGYDVMPQDGDCSRESNVRTFVFLNKVRYQNATLYGKYPTSDNAVRRWLQLCWETASVLGPLDFAQQCQWWPTWTCCSCHLLSSAERGVPARWCTPYWARIAREFLDNISPSAGLDLASSPTLYYATWLLPVWIR